MRQKSNMEFAASVTGWKLLYEAPMKDKLYDLRISAGTDVDTMLAEFREKYPEIVGRKRFCCYESERTPAFNDFLKRHNMEIVEVN